MPKETKLPRVYVNLWSPVEPDWSEDEVETCICFKREPDAITESCNGFALYVPFEEIDTATEDLRVQLAEANRQLTEVTTICNATIREREETREKLATREDDLIRAGKLWDITQLELAEANRTIEALKSVSLANAWDEAWQHGADGYSNSNPYR